MASLEKHNQPLDSRLAKHLLRRACFHYSQELLNESEGKTPDQVLSILKKNKELNIKKVKESLLCLVRSYFNIYEKDIKR